MNLKFIVLDKKNEIVAIFKNKGNAISFCHVIGVSEEHIIEDNLKDNLEDNK